ncbi:hypothetical protein [Chryseobacterium shigense]|nr:hypothetical protein [Chryseobacterium shigense]
MKKALIVFITDQFKTWWLGKKWISLKTLVADVPICFANKKK